jgi:hypothetical protein
MARIEAAAASDMPSRSPISAGAATPAARHCITASSISRHK